MCDHCVIESVKRQMRAEGASRRDLFRLAGAGVVAASAGGMATTPARAAAHAPGVRDLTHTLHPDFPTFSGTPQFSAEQTVNFADNGYNGFILTVDEHTGTHIDAPLHFSADGASVDEIPVEQLVAPLCIIDIRAKAEADADAQVTPDDLEAWIAANGAIPSGACMAMLSGWAAHVDTDMFRNADAEGVMHFPGFHPDATAMLLEDGNAIGMAVDTLSIDFGASADFATHYAWLPSGRWGLECVAGLDDMPVTGATIVVGAPKHRGGSGGPTRALALVS